jgi:uncharacterized protein YecT (DUF1311 family)
VAPKVDPESVLSEQIATALVGALGTLTVVLLGAVGFLLKRRITGAGRQERAQYLSVAADVLIKMKQAGLEPQQVGQLEAFLNSQSPEAAEGTLKVIEGDDAGLEQPDDGLPSVYWSTHPVQARAYARLELLDAMINQQMMELFGLLESDRWELISTSQEAWKEFRKAEAHYAITQYSGGTIAPLIGALRQIAISEHRLKELEAEVNERKTFDRHP